MGWIQALAFWRRPRLQVWVVCTANVCRSPLAAAMLRHRLQQNGMERDVLVRSAGTRVGQRGRPADPRVAKLAAAVGIPMGRTRAQPLSAQQVLDADLVLPMEQRHVQEIARMLPGERVPSHVRLLGSFDQARGADTDIPDPYFGDASGFDRVYERIDAALGPVVTTLQQQLVADDASR